MGVPKTHANPTSFFGEGGLGGRSDMKLAPGFMRDDLVAGSMRGSVE